MDRSRTVAVALLVVMAGTVGLIQYDRMEFRCNNSLALSKPIATFAVQQSGVVWRVRHDGGDAIRGGSNSKVSVNITYPDGSLSTFLWSELEGGTYPITEGDAASLSKSSLPDGLDNATVQVVWFGVNTATPKYCDQWPLFEDRMHLREPMKTIVEES